MAKRTEGYFQGHDNTELFYQTWLSPEPKGSLVITHGIAEHSECYQYLAAGLESSQWNIYAWDLRGHGRSEGKRGLVKNFHDFQKDLLAFINFLSQHHDLFSRPLLLLGHSMGGLITFQTALEEDVAGLHGVILSSPAFGLSMPVPFIKDKASKLLARWVPSLTLQNEILYESLTQDQRILKTYPNDPLRHDKISPQLYLGMLESFGACYLRASEFGLPLLMQISGQDRLVSPKASEEIFELVSSRQKEKHIYKNSFHEIYNDIERTLVYRDLQNFLATFGDSK